MNFEHKNCIFTVISFIYFFKNVILKSKTSSGRYLHLGTWLDKRQNKMKFFNNIVYNMTALQTFMALRL